MKIQDLVENVDRHRSMSKGEVLDHFFDRIKGFTTNNLQDLARELINIELTGSEFDQNSAKFPDPENIDDPRILISMIGNLSNELSDNESEDFHQLIVQVLGTDEIHSPG